MIEEMFSIPCFVVAFCTYAWKIVVFVSNPDGLPAVRIGPYHKIFSSVLELVPDNTDMSVLNEAW